tara:strand:+ start:131647 stop:132261 length:615 start_codon:yes stop_codon:yes gene_type:complete
MFDYLSIALIALLAAISPGPDFVVVAKNALAHNRTSAIMTSIGIGAGILIHASYCVLGLAIVISQSLLLFSVIKYLGAAYLIYLGVKSLFTKTNHLPSADRHAKQRSPMLAFRDGLLTNILNPKCTLFMLSVFTLVVKPHTPTFVQATYGIEIALITAVWFVFLSYGLTIDYIKSKLEKVQHIVNKLIGAVLIAFGVVVIFDSH